MLIRITIFLWFLLALRLPSYRNAYAGLAHLPVRTVDPSVSPDKLPYELHSEALFSTFGTPALVSHRSADIDGDGYSERIYTHSTSTGPGLYTSAIVSYRNPFRQDAEQFNGRYSTCRIWSTNFMDIVAGPGEDLILTKHLADTILFEIVSWDSVFNVDTTYVIAAVGCNMVPAGGWNAIHVEPVAVFDVNGDGIRDLIYSRSAKPDSAFPRGIVAYDVAHRRQLWFYPTADLSSLRSFHVVRASDGAACFVFITPSCQNAYAANGMDSFHAYLISIDRDGRELWRCTIGREGFYPQSVAMDANGDQVPDIYTSIDSRLTAAHDAVTLRCYDAFKGEVLASAELPGTEFMGLSMTRISRSHASTLLVAISGRDSPHLLYRLNSRLETETVVAGPFEGISAMDLDGDGADEVVMHTRDRGTAILAFNLDPLAWAPVEGTPQLCRHPDGASLLLERGAAGFDLLRFRRRPLAAVMYARYKWHLAVVVAGALFGLLSVGAIWVGRLYRTVTGVPSLNRVNAMLLVLDQKGRLILANENELVAALFGGRIAKRKRYDSEILAAQAPMVELIRESFLEPYAPRQGQFDLPTGRGNRRVELTIYPRVNKRNELLGKVVIAEDITGRVGWQRKAVLAEATQQWIHRLKGNMATARIVIGNLVEDQRLTKLLADTPALAGYVQSLQKQIDQTADVTRRILHFAGIGKPQLDAHDLNTLVDIVVGPYIQDAPRDVTVAKMQQVDLPPVRIDPDQMAEVIDNLLTNALNALRDGGRVVVTTRLADDLPHPSAGRAVELIVEDTGAGIAPEDLDRIFLPGFTRSPGGTGIGLALVKEIVENHGGQVLVESNLGCGSRFTVRIPVGR